eukprot:749240-Hanusia_phi.AAC.3
MGSSVLLVDGGERRRLALRLEPHAPVHLLHLDVDRVRSLHRVPLVPELGGELEAARPDVAPQDLSRALHGVV